MAKGKQKARSERSASRVRERMSKPPDLRNLIRGSMSPAPIEELVASLHPAAGLSLAEGVFFRPPSVAPPREDDEDEDGVSLGDDGDDTVRMSAPPGESSAPPPAPNTAQDRDVVMEGVDGSSFMANFDNPEAFYASGAKEKVQQDLEAATLSLRHVTEAMNLWTNNGYRLPRGPPLPLLPSSSRPFSRSQSLASSSKPLTTSLIRSLLKADL